MGCLTERNHCPQSTKRAKFGRRYVPHAEELLCHHCQTTPSCIPSNSSMEDIRRLYKKCHSVSRRKMSAARQRTSAGAVLIRIHISQIPAATVRLRAAVGLLALV